MPRRPGFRDNLLDMGSSLLSDSESASQICEMDPLASKLDLGNWEGPALGVRVNLGSCLCCSHFRSQAQHRAQWLLLGAFCRPLVSSPLRKHPVPKPAVGPAPYALLL